MVVCCYNKNNPLSNQNLNDSLVIVKSIKTNSDSSNCTVFYIYDSLYRIIEKNKYLDNNIASLEKELYTYYSDGSLKNKSIYWSSKLYTSTDYEYSNGLKTKELFINAIDFINEVKVFEYDYKNNLTVKKIKTTDQISTRTLEYRYINEYDDFGNLIKVGNYNIIVNGNFSENDSSIISYNIYNYINNKIMEEYLHDVSNGDTLIVNSWYYEGNNLMSYFDYYDGFYKHTRYDYEYRDNILFKEIRKRYDLTKSPNGVLEHEKVYYYDYVKGH